jgi:hypothetical protein
MYLASMRLQYALISLLFVTACGGRSMNNHLARDLIVEFPRETLEKKDIEVLSITQVSGSTAIAETTVKAAFRFEKDHGAWVVREVRLGHGQWEKVDNLVTALGKVKSAETGEMLDRIVESIEKYRKANGTLPVFRDYIGLADLLSPRYLTPLIRLDAWRRPFAAESAGANTMVIRSAGPDGKFGTSDDIYRTFPPK